MPRSIRYQELLSRASARSATAISSTDRNGKEAQTARAEAKGKAAPLARPSGVFSNKSSSGACSNKLHSNEMLPDKASSGAGPNVSHLNGTIPDRESKETRSSRAHLNGTLSGKTSGGARSNKLHSNEMLSDKASRGTDSNRLNSNESLLGKTSGGACQNASHFNGTITDRESNVALPVKASGEALPNRPYPNESLPSGASGGVLSSGSQSGLPDTSKIDGIDPSPSASKAFSAKIHMIPADLIRPNPSQPRKSFDDEAILRLSESIKQYGILQPLSVRSSCSLPDEKLISGEIQLIGEDHTYYEIIAGERRFRAAKLAGMTKLPCIIMTVDSKKSAELAIIENIQREDLNIFEQASAIASLIDIYKLTQEQIAGMLSVSQSYIANKLRILKLTADERTLILESHLTERHARAVLRISDISSRLQAIKTIIAHEMNVSKTEAYIEQLLSGSTGDKAERPITGKRKLVLKDIRLFYNTIDRAIDTMERAGISVAKERHDSEGVTELIIRISNNPNGINLSA